MLMQRRRAWREPRSIGWPDGYLLSSSHSHLIRVLEVVPSAAMTCTD